jgi:prefoldin subunit 5
MDFGTMRKKGNDLNRLVDSVRGFADYLEYLRQNMTRMQRIQADLQKRVAKLEKNARQ